MPPNPLPAAAFLIAIIAFAMTSASAAPDADDTGITVDLRRSGDAIEVDVDMRIEATPDEVWAVLTDYDHMASFVSNVIASRVVRHAGDTLEVEQASRLAFGPLELTFENVREATLKRPVEIRTRLLHGDMKDSTFTTRLTAENPGTHVTNHGYFIADRWIPPVIGTSVLAAETRKQFAEFRAEILRRKREAPRRRKRSR